jgi:hypothetical protein
MKYKLLLAALLCSLAVWVNSSAAQEAKSDKAHLAAAHELFQAMQFEKTFAKTIEATVDMQVKANPMIAPYKKVMMEFFSKYMSWSSLKADMAKIYISEFTIQEIRELTAFYRTPVGTKAALRMPELMRKGGDLGMKRVQKHMPELQQMIAAEMAKKK